MLIYLNGKYMPQERASISIDDRGFLFGDGVYEVTRAVRGRLFEAERHMQRLERGVRGLKMPASSFDAESLLDVANHLLAANALHDADAIVYMQITRGAAVRTHHFPPADTPVTVFASARAFASREQLRAQGVPAITHPDIRWARCDLKTINLLGNVLANQEARESGAHEALFVRDG
ncbi:MAG: aminotransferase class IV, partial [Gemmatimonadaceae bacterium]